MRSRNRNETALGRPHDRPRIGILVVAYNAVGTLATTLDRIPREVWDTVDEVFVFDDASADETTLVAEGYRATRQQEKLTVVRNEQNLGYGGNQKLGYRYAMERGLDYVVLLHGDGQYAPEEMPRLLEPLLNGRADAVFGSRMMVAGGARRGGMPLYKRLGNRILTTIQNRLAGMSLTEWHSGYRAYSVSALRAIDFERNTDDFHFDTEIILQLAERGFRIHEVPIPVYYGDEICYVNGFSYAWHVVRTAFEHRLFHVGVRADARFWAAPRYESKRGRHSSHQQIRDMLRPGERVLDLGCEPHIARMFADRGCEVTGVGLADIAGGGLSDYYRRDLAGGINLRTDEPFDTVVAADILEHLSQPERILAEAADYLRPDGRVIVSVPNVAFLPVRLMLLAGRFTYARRGIMDSTHLRFFTRSSLKRLAEQQGYRVERWGSTPPPFERLARNEAGPALKALESFSYWLSRVRPQMFAFQLIAVLRPRVGAGGRSLSLAEGASTGSALHQDIR